MSGLSYAAQVVICRRLATILQARRVKKFKYPIQLF